MYVFMYIHTYPRTEDTPKGGTHRSACIYRLYKKSHITYVTHVLTVYAQILQDFAAISQMI